MDLDLDVDLDSLTPRLRLTHTQTRAHHKSDSQLDIPTQSIYTWGDEAQDLEHGPKAVISTEPIANSQQPTHPVVWGFLCPHSVIKPRVRVVLELGEDRGMYRCIVVS